MLTELAIAVSDVRACRLNPGKKLSREQIPYKQLRGLVGELVSNNSTLNGEERNGSSTLDVSDDSSSRISFEESFSTRSKSMLRSMTSSRKMLSASRVPRQARGMMQIRARRRKASYTPRFTSFECTEEELRSGFSSFHEKLLDTCATSIECYHVIINSLNNFFTHNTWTNNVERLVNEFMHDNVLMSCAELGAKYDRCGESGDGGRRLREYELMALLEIRLLGENCAAAVEESDVLNKLRFIYFAGDLQRLRDFLDETISDQFAHVKPLVVTRIYEELCMKLPFDLQIYAREESKDTEGEFELESAAVLQRRAGQAESLDRLINGDDSDESLDCPPANASYIERHRTSATERSSRHPYKSQHSAAYVLSKILYYRRDRGYVLCANIRKETSIRQIDILGLPCVPFFVLAAVFLVFPFNGIFTIVYNSKQAGNRSGLG
ncbi:unnamed protein product [Toxocara canis]|uniref:Treslin STD domain-containing protein n=1 Tax=Toxocara canis TaxID=6265 RepID=A0A183UXY2_TOXCA|nr:unnamed protein product [Toxocara canis]